MRSQIPYGTIFPQTQGVEFEEVIILTCYSATRVTWDIDVQNLKGYRQTNNTLIITNADNSKAGSYSCFGTYPDEQKFSTSATVLVGRK